ncbi:MAG: hypothetical protein R2695_20895 [Acidimicrobiales bacterium]
MRFSGSTLRSRRAEIARLEDEWEALHDRGWSDGLPVVPPTEAPRAAHARGHDPCARRGRRHRAPDLVECTVEKVAINAVMAGCKPEYLPVVLAAVEAACTDEFNMHGLLATTMPVGPVLIVNGPIRNEIGMNSGLNLLGQGNRANSTIGRALQLTIRNVGGGKPGGVDRATQGSPAKIGLCFAEDEEGSPWDTFAESRGFDRSVSTVTLFPGEGPRLLFDQKSRRPESLYPALRRDVAGQREPSDGDADGHGDRDVARAHEPLSRRRMGPGPFPRRAHHPPHDRRRRDHRRRRRHRGGDARLRRRHAAPEVPAGRHPRRARRQPCRAVLVDDRRVGDRRDG